MTDQPPRPTTGQPGSGGDPGPRQNPPWGRETGNTAAPPESKKRICPDCGSDLDIHPEPGMIYTRCPRCYPAGSTSEFAAERDRAVSLLSAAARRIIERVYEIYQPDYIKRCYLKEPDSFLALVIGLDDALDRVLYLRSTPGPFGCCSSCDRILELLPRSGRLKIWACRNCNPDRFSALEVREE